MEERSADPFKRGLKLGETMKSLDLKSYHVYSEKEVRQNGDVVLISQGNMMGGLCAIALAFGLLGFCWGKTAIPLIHYTLLCIGIVALVMALKYMFSWPSAIVRCEGKEVIFYYSFSKDIVSLSHAFIAVYPVKYQYRGTVEKHEFVAVLAQKYDNRGILFSRSKKLKDVQS